MLTRRIKLLSQVLEGLAALEEAKLKEAIDEEKKKVRDLEAQMKRSAEVYRNPWACLLIAIPQSPLADS